MHKILQLSLLLLLPKSSKQEDWSVPFEITSNRTSDLKFDSCCVGGKNCKIGSSGLAVTISSGEWNDSF